MFILGLLVVIAGRVLATVGVYLGLLALIAGFGMLFGAVLGYTRALSAAAGP